MYKISKWTDLIKHPERAETPNLTEMWWVPPRQLPSLSAESIVTPMSRFDDSIMRFLYIQFVTLTFAKTLNWGFRPKLNLDPKFRSRACGRSVSGKKADPRFKLFLQKPPLLAPFPLRDLSLHASLPLHRFLPRPLRAPLLSTRFSARSVLFTAPLTLRLHALDSGLEGILQSSYRFQTPLKTRLEN